MLLTVANYLRGYLTKNEVNEERGMVTRPLECTENKGMSLTNIDELKYISHFTYSKIVTGTVQLDRMPTTSKKMFFQNLPNSFGIPKDCSFTITTSIIFYNLVISLNSHNKMIVEQPPTNTQNVLALYPNSK